MEAARLTAKIDADSKEGEEGLKRFHGLLGDAAGGFKHLLETAGGFALGGGILAGIGAIGGFLTDAVHAGENANTAIAQTAAVLKSTNGAAGVTAQQVDQLATQYMKLSGVQDDTVRGAENMLLTFTNIHSNVFPQATKTVLDMSQALGQDTKSSAIQLGKALNDPIHGITALQRVGVTFTEQQKEQIKQMMAAGNTAGAQGVILAELQKEFGGSAEAAGKANGGIKILSAQFDNMKQSLGQALIPVLGQVMTAVQPLIAKLGDVLPGILADVTSFISGDLSPALSQLGNFVNSTVLPALSQLGDFIETNVLPALKSFGQWAEKNVVPALEKLGKWVTTVVVPALMQLATWFEQHVLPIIRVVAQVFMTDVLPALEQVATAVLQHLLPSLENLCNQVSPILIPALQTVGAILKNVVGPAISDVIGFISGLINGISTAIDWIKKAWGWFDSLASKLNGGVTDAVNAIGSTFSTVFQGMMSAVKDPLNWIIGAINVLIDGLDSIQISIPDWSPIAGGQKFGIDIPEIPKLASGGDISGPFIGAERGMELLVTPGLYAAPPGSHVYNAQETQRLLSGGGPSRPNVTNTYNIYPAKERFDAQEMDRLQRRAAFLANTGGGY